MTTLKENSELQGKVDEDEDDIDSLTEKNRQLVKQVCVVSKFISLTLILCPSLVLSSVSVRSNSLVCKNRKFISFLLFFLFSPFFGLTIGQFLTLRGKNEKSICEKKGAVIKFLHVQVRL